LPAFIEWHENGQLKSQSWWKDGKRHRDSPEVLAAYIGWYKNGQLLIQSWWKDDIKIKEESY